jgi:hypothetical protein
MSVTERQKSSAYHCGIDELLKAAYQRDFTMNEMGKCKTKFRTFNEWYQTLNDEQKHRVDEHLENHFNPPSKAELRKLYPGMPFD